MNRHLLFHSEGWELDLIVSRQDGRIGVFGQILPNAPTEKAHTYDALAVLAHEEHVVQTTKLSSRGEFEFRNVPDSELKIELFLNSQRLTAAFRP
jgi:hypothetical protein